MLALLELMIARLGSPTILVRTGYGKTAKSWSALSSIGQSQVIGLYWVGAACSWRDFLGKKKQSRFGG